jgi:hypothetical protein
MTIEISIGSLPDYIEFNDVMNNIKETPDFTQFSISESNIYQTLWPANQFASGQALVAIILKGGLEVQIIGTSSSYKYDKERESLFLTRIAERLPYIKSARVPCALVLVDELKIRFPNLSGPNNELGTNDNYPVSICKYANDDMEFRVYMAASDDYARHLTDEAEYAISVSNLFTHFSTSGAEIYYFGGSNEDNKPGEFFAAMIVKGNVGIRVQGMGYSYQYSAEREKLLLEAIAARLP